MLTLQRSGSDMLRSVLDAHPEVTCFGELMLKTPRDMSQQGYRGTLRILERVDPKFRRDSVRFAHPRAFVDEVMAKLATTPVAGFKLMLNQHPQFMRELIGDPTYTKIFLYRANHLASYSSHKIAKATGQGAASIRMKVKRAKVTFFKGEFRRFVNRRERLLTSARGQLAKTGENYLEIEYLELVNGDGISDVLNFLGVDPTYEVKARTLRRNPSNLLERFNNPEEVQKALTDMGIEHWSTEQLGGAGVGNPTDRRNLWNLVWPSSTAS
jgi:hypothetical protein